MTTPSTARKAGPYSGTGAQTSFPFTFKVFAASDVKVVVADANGDETVLTLGAQYSVTLNSNQETSPGGTITYPISGSPLPVGGKLSIVGNLPYDQPLDLPSGGNFSPLALENQLDRATIQIQQLKEQVDRAAKVPVTYDAADLEEFTADIVRLADSADNIDTVAQNIATVNAVADDIADVNTVASNIGNVAAAGANIAAVVTVANDLNEPVSEIETVAGSISNVNAVGGSIAGVNTVAGSIASVNAVAAVAADVTTVADNVADVTNFADVYYGPSATDPALRRDGSALQNGDLYFNTGAKRMRVFDGAAWVEGSVNAGTITVQRFSGNGSTTAFTLSADPVSENNTQVYIGGVYQQKDQYSVSGTTLTFSAAPPAGTDNIEVLVTATLALGTVGAEMVASDDGAGGVLFTTVAGFIGGTALVVRGDGVTDKLAAINAAKTIAAAEKRPLVLQGVIKTSGTVDLSAVRIVIANDAVIQPTFDSGIAVQYVAASGSLIEDNKLLGNLTVEWPTRDWTKDRTSFFFCNVYNGEFHISSKRGTRAIVCRGDESGTVHNNFYLGQIWNHNVGVWLESASATGWCNMNRFHGGFFYGSAEVSGSLYAAQAGHIYIASAPYQNNGNVFLYPSLEWVSIDNGFRLARMGGTRNKLFIGYAESNGGDTTWFVDTGVKNLINAQLVPYAIGYDPTVAGSSNRIDVSGAQEPWVVGTQGYIDSSGEGTQHYVNNSATRPTMNLKNIGGGAALNVVGGINFSDNPSIPQVMNYATGVFSPVVVGSTSAGTGTYDRLMGRYTRIGNRIFVTVSVKWTAHTGTGDLQIAGLPVASLNQGETYTSFSIWQNGIALSANNVLQALLFPNDTKIRFYQYATGGGATGLVPMDAVGELHLTGSYEV